MITNVADTVQLEYQLNRPTVLTFNVPSEHKLVNIVHDDGDPYLAVGNRLVKGYRKVSTSSDELPAATTNWTLKFVGRIWHIEDAGDSDTVNTAVTVVDPLHDCVSRLVRSASGDFQKHVSWWGPPAGTDTGDSIIKDMIDRTNACALAPLLFDTGGTFDTCAYQTAGWDQAFIMPSIVTLTDTGTVDISLEYADYMDITQTDWTQHAHLSAMPRLGSDKPAVIFGYAAPPQTVSQFNRTVDMATFANDVTLWGKTIAGHTAHEVDSASAAKYGAFEEASSLSDINTLELIQMLASEQLYLRSKPKDIVSITPLQGVSALPFDEWFLGDTVTVNVGRTPFPVTRESFHGVQRIYGFTLTVDADVGERVDSLIVSAQAESVTPS